MEEKEKHFFEQIYEQYKKLMLSQAMMYTEFNREEAEDIVHDTFVKLIGKYGVLSELNEKARAAYIIYSVRNAAINRYKHLAVEEKYKGTYKPADVSVSAENQWMAALPPEDLISGWAKLSPKDRDLLIFRY